MKQPLILMIVLTLLFCTACSPIQTEQDVSPATEPSGTASTEATDSPVTPTIPAGNPDTHITNLLTDINLTGTLLPSEQPVAPGTLPDISRIPLADQTTVGKTVTVNLGSNQAEGSFLFRFDTQSNKGRLAVILHAKQAFYIPLLLVLETDLDSHGLCRVLSTGEDFNATVLSATNISFEEGMYTACNLSADELREFEIVDVCNPAEAYTTTSQFLGRFGGQTEPALFKLDLAISYISAPLASKFLSFSRVFDRFSVQF